MKNEEEVAQDFSSYEKLNSKTVASQWTDSGICITDSGLSIDSNYSTNDDDTNEEEVDSEAYTLSVRDAYEPDQDGDTLLHLAIIQGLTDIAFALIRIVPHPDFLDISNHLSQTPLHLATILRHHLVIRRLIISGSTIDLRDRNGNTALHLACRQSDLNSVQAIISPIDKKEINNAEVVNYPIGVQHLPSNLLNLINYEGETCVHLAVYNTNKKIIDFLVKSGADVNAQEGKSGKSILHMSVEMQKYDLVQFLVNQCRAKVNIKSYAGHTPLHYAWMALALNRNNSKLRSIVKFLRECGGEPSEPPVDSDSDTDSSDEE